VPGGMRTTPPEGGRASKAAWSVGWAKASTTIGVGFSWAKPVMVRAIKGVRRRMFMVCRGLRAEV